MSMENLARTVSEIVTQARGREFAIVSDFDGTLSELVDVPDDAVLRDDAREALEALRRARCPILVVSGRSLEDLRARVPMEGIALAGEHGGDLVLADGERFTAEMNSAARDALESFAAVAGRLLEGGPGHVEQKLLACTAHTRRVPDEERPALARALCREAVALTKTGAVEALIGKHTVELRVRGATKDRALWIFASSAGRGAMLVALGDDIGDEELFTATNDLGGYTIKVGEGWSVAKRALAGPAEVAVFLGALAASRDPAAFTRAGT